MGAASIVNSASPQRVVRRALLGIVLLAVVWRIAIAALLPALSRDGVTFCWFARDLAQQGPAYLQQETTQQHPLFPLLILGVRNTAVALGAPDSPWTWQYSGQLVALIAGTAVILLAAALTTRLVRRLELPVAAPLAAAFAAALAGALDLNIWLSADVMSDQVHLAFYLAGILCLVELRNWRIAAAAGCCAGLAFLTRPEGLVVALAGLVTIAAQARTERTEGAWRRGAGRALALLAAFAALAAPYAAITGKLTPKKNVYPAAEETRGDPGSDEAVWVAAHPAAAQFADRRAQPALPVVLARLETQRVSWYALAPLVVLTIFRAGRVVVPLLALAPVMNLRGRWLRPPLIGLNVCAAGHFALTTILLQRWGYLDPRHTLVLVLLLVPFAAFLLARLWALFWPARRMTAVVLLLIVFGPLAVYGLRLPNADDDVYVRTAAWLAARDPDLRGKLLTGDNLQKRIAFYGDLRWRYWLQEPEAWDLIRGEFLAQRPDYFTLEIGPRGERRGNAALLERLRADPQIGPALHALREEPVRDEIRLHVYELRWPR